MPERARFEPKETLFESPEDTAAWFAGVLEVGATTGIPIADYTNKKGHNYVRALPYIEIHSTYPPVLDKLQSTYGGMKQSRRWIKSGREAAEIVASTLPFTVAREEHALAMINWLNATSVEERVEDARDLDHLGWQQKAKSKDYYQLLQNPAFVAGILDSRAYMTMRPSKYHTTLELQITSKNEALLQAMKETFGGHLRVETPSGTVVNHSTMNFTTKQDSYSLNPIGTSAIELVDYAKEFMLTPPPSNYKYQREVERQQEKSEERDKLVQQVVAEVILEIALFETGEIKRLSSNLTLAKMFKVRQETIEACLKSQLSEDLYQKRRELIKQFAGRSVDAQIARQLTEFIADEIQKFERGEIQRISYKPELAETFGVGKKGLTGFLQTLPPETKEKRDRILKSQISRERNEKYWGARKNNQSQ